VRALRLLHRRVHQYDHATVDLRFYECELVDERCEPTAPFGWVSRNQLRTLPFPEGNQDVLKLLVEGS
jgi:hypothetical protein